MLAAAEAHGPGEARRFYAWSERVFNNTDRVLRPHREVRPEHQTATLLVTIGTLVATIYLYIVVPKGFFPVQDTGVIMGISDAPREHFVRGHGGTPAGAGHVILKDKDVESLSSFIGVDGTNTTPNSGRIQINLKPRDERNDDVTDIMRRLQQEAGRRRGHHALHAAGAGPDGRRPRQPHPISVQPGGCRSQGTGNVDARSWWTS